MYSTGIFVTVGLIILFSTVWGFNRGILRMIIPLASIIISILIAYYTTAPIVKLVTNNSFAYSTIEEKVKKSIPNPSQKIDTKDLQNKYIEEANYPAIIKEALINGNTKENYEKLGVDSFSDYLSKTISSLVTKAMVSVGIFVIAFIIVRIICRVLKIANNLPIIHGVSSVLGAILGLAIGIIIAGIVVIVYGLLTADLSGFEALNSLFSNKVINETLNNNLFLKWLL